MKKRVSIGMCWGPADAALVRSVFEAHDIYVLIGAEHHAGLMGGLGGAFVPLDIIVDGAGAEEAAALLRDIREGDHEATSNAADEPDPEPGDPSLDERADAAAVWSYRSEKLEDDLPGAAAIGLVSNRRRRTALALLLAFFISFGTAHMSTRAWLRGMALAGVEILGFMYLIVSPSLALALICGAMLGDAIGAVWRIWSGIESRAATDPAHSR